ncbi:hypothetical protein HAX54_034365 [Datura stramonium]|uniref:Uncharacterized protein n=1 Tax=Datura stramonium TaxID=4076 RepID=A0ABS8SEE4_DATST|nr:hypothetical protein [Datura stramonium]
MGQFIKQVACILFLVISTPLVQIEARKSKFMIIPASPSPAPTPISNEISFPPFSSLSPTPSPTPAPTPTPTPVFNDFTFPPLSAVSPTPASAPVGGDQDPDGNDTPTPAGAPEEGGIEAPAPLLTDTPYGLYGPHSQEVPSTVKNLDDVETKTPAEEFQVYCSALL